MAHRIRTDAIDLGPRYLPIRVSFAARQVTSFFGTPRVRHGDVRATTLGFALIFPHDSDAP